MSSSGAASAVAVYRELSWSSKRSRRLEKDTLPSTSPSSLPPCCHHHHHPRKSELLADETDDDDRDTAVRIDDDDGILMRSKYPGALFLDYFVTWRDGMSSCASCGDDDESNKKYDDDDAG